MDAKYWIIGVLCIAFVSGATVTISDTPVPGQAEDMRIGVHLGNTATRYSTNMMNNFIGNGDFEDQKDWKQYPFDDKWDHDVPGLTWTYDPEHYDGQQSLKVTVTSQAVGDGVGQWASNKEYKNGRDYVFSCYLKQVDMSGTNAQMQFYISDTGSNCPGGFEAHQDFAVTNDWQKYEFTFTMDKDCKPIDPQQGGANSKRINLLSTGTLYIDRCLLYDKEHMTPWGLNKEYLDLLRDLRPHTVRYGALDVNELEFGDMVGDIWGRTEDRAGIAEYLQLAHLTGANPDLVLPVVYSDDDYNNLIEYMFGPPESTYGAMREQQGYLAWDFDTFYYELGNELMCRSTSMQSPGPCEWSGANYGDWSTPIINLFKDNQYWDDSRDQIGFNVWYDSSKLNAALLETEISNTGGGRADFIMPAKYFGGHNAFSVAQDGTKTDYTQSQLTVDTDIYFGFSFGTADLMKTYIDYTNELTTEKYGRVLDFGIYEYGPSGYPDGKSQEFFDLEKSLGFGVSWLDRSVALKNYGAEAINLFYYQGPFGSYSWSLVDAYPYEHKRPAYHLFKLYGQYVRGELLERQLDSSTYDPFGPGADQYNSFGCSRSYGACQNSDWGLTDWKYPTDVTLVEVYPFKLGQRYSILVINRDLNDAHDVTLNLPYNPNSDAMLHYVTGDEPEITNENADNVVLESTTITDFADGYLLTIQPHSAYVIVNYASSASVCLDEDSDGYGANEFENQCTHSEIDCADYNFNINPGASSWCDCDDSDGYYLGGFEVEDSIDNDCDGIVDNEAVNCITLGQIAETVNSWKMGNINMIALMEKIGGWKNGC